MAKNSACKEIQDCSVFDKKKLLPQVGSQYLFRSYIEGPGWHHVGVDLLYDTTKVAWRHKLPTIDVFHGIGQKNHSVELQRSFRQCSIEQ